MCSWGLGMCRHILTYSTSCDMGTQKVVKSVFLAYHNKIPRLTMVRDPPEQYITRSLALVVGHLPVLENLSFCNTKNYGFIERLNP